MKVLVVGGGGREHVLAWKLSQSPRLSELYAYPMNAGLDEVAEPVPLTPGADAKDLAQFARQTGIDLTIVGPEAFLCAGIADIFSEQGLRLFGPTSEAAQIEGSKIWAKDFFRKYNIPSAAYHIFDNYSSAYSYIKDQSYPIVIKADGLAAGKGVIVARTLREAEDALKKILVDRVFGDAGNQIVVEEFLRGEEASILAFVDGKHVLFLLPAQDHKPLLDGDQGPNTGGMGAICPTPLVNEQMKQEVLTKVFQPTLEGMIAEGIEYVGCLYAGLMITEDGPKVLEFNCRFGDPEVQSVIPLMQSDLLDHIEATLEGRLNLTQLQWREHKTCVTVVMAAPGYPGKYEKNIPISGLDQFHPRDKDTIVFHAGTWRNEGRVMTTGGRVLGVTAVGDSPEDARNRAYEAVQQIQFGGAQYRTDIGARAVNVS